MAAVKMEGPQIKKGHKRRNVAIIYFLLLIFLVGSMYGINSYQQRVIKVVAINRDMNAGDKITQDDLEPYGMLAQTYNSLGNQSYTDDEGKKQTGQVFVKWDNRQELVGMTVKTFAKQDETITRKIVTKNSIDRNPWYSKIAAGDEIYTMDFKSTDVDTRLLLPGSLLRLRLVANVSVEQAQGLKDEIAKDNPNSANPSSTTSSNADGSTPVENGTETAGYTSLKLSGINIPQDDRATTVPVAEIAFDQVRVIDMLNGDGESIFDIYMEISRMPSSARESYFKKNVTGGGSDFIKRITPKSFVFVFTEQQANMVAELENSKGMVQKYTILKEGTQEPLYKTFSDISDEINASIASNVAN